ncbi:MAG: ATP-binding protein, partial [Candidatus Marinimicrobia bacterium]|nr:ATP-binding protein [Candidatus Neomarinimicrobiota bacterium]
TDGLAREAADDLRGRFVRLACEEPEHTEADHPTGKGLARLTAARDTFAARQGELVALLTLDTDLAWGPPDEPDHLTWLRERLARHRNPNRPFELLREDGILLRVQEQPLPNGGLITMASDITEQKAVEDQLRQAQKMEAVGQLPGGVAHDFNNLLAAILGNIELAAYRVGEDTKIVSLLSNAQKATKRAAKLTQQLLTFSKGGDPVKETTSISKLISESADFVLHGSPVSCDYTFPDDLWMVNVDSGQLGQVIQNIVINAKHAMPEGGRRYIRCGNVEDAASEALLSLQEGDFIRITIQDTGIGIPQEMIDKVFDPYFTTKQAGSGLGLAICHSIINKHDGHISVQSSPGKGTTFTIYLPVDPSVDIPVAKQQKPGSAVKAARIMVMDDDEIIRTLVQAQLYVLGHETVLVADGEQAINKYQELQDGGAPVDLVIMDLTIPGGMGGQEAAQQLLQIDPDAKIIVSSGYSNDPVLASYREYGFCAAIAKPFDLAELMKSIESTLS